MIQDGHHRAVSTLLGGRKFFTDEEYQIQHWNYDEYLQVNLKNGWYTPYDPKTEVRIEDIKTYKEEVQKLIGTKALEKLAKKYVICDSCELHLPCSLLDGIEAYKFQI